eukprot:4456770-Lingulodinium_polyedra.AAC.1
MLSLVFRIGPLSRAPARHCIEHSGLGRLEGGHLMMSSASASGAQHDGQLVPGLGYLVLWARASG